MPLHVQETDLSGHKGNDTCPNCGTAMAEGNYCSQCGQKRIGHDDYSFAHFTGHALHELTHFDAKFFRSFATLFTHPGKITEDHLAGRRGCYMQPMQLFIIANVLFFIVAHFEHIDRVFATPLEMLMQNRWLNSTGLVQYHLAKTHEAFASYKERFNHVIAGQSKSLIILMVPLFALAVYGFYHRSNRYYMPHIIFSLHFFTFFLLALVFVIFPLDALAEILSDVVFHVQPQGELVMLSLICGISFTYLYVAARRVYRTAVLPTLIKSAVFPIVLSYALLVYRFILFFSAYLFA